MFHIHNCNTGSIVSLAVSSVDLSDSFSWLLGYSGAMSKRQLALMLLLGSVYFWTCVYLVVR